MLLSPKVSIIIINFKNLVYIHNCIASLLNMGYMGREIIVVDCCTDGIEGSLERYGGMVRLIHSSTDLGASEQHNLGFMAIERESKYSFFLDNDTEVSSDCLERVVGRAEDTGAAVVQPSIFSLSRRGKLLEKGLRSGIFGIPKPERGIDPPFFASGCGYLVRNDAFRGTGGYDSKFFLGVDDLDLSWRLRLYGHSIVQEPGAKVFHGVGSVSSRLNPIRFYHILKNTLRMLVKNYSFPLNFIVCGLFLTRIPMEAIILKLLPPSSAYRINALAKVRVKNGSELVVLFLRAILWNIRNYRDTWALHQVVQRNRKIGDRQIMKHMTDRGLLFVSESYNDLL